MALNEDLVKNDPDRSDGWGGETEHSRLAPGPALGGVLPQSFGISGQQRGGPVRRLMRGSCPGPCSQKAGPQGSVPKARGLHPQHLWQPPCTGRWVLGQASERGCQCSWVDRGPSLSPGGGAGPVW